MSATPFSSSLRLEAPPLYFMHIPKTAGAAWSSILFSAYARRSAARVYYFLYSQYSLDSLRTKRVIASHLGPGLLPWLPQANLRCVTILRDPVEQYISNLYFRQMEIIRHPEIFAPEYYEQVRPLLKADLPTLLRTPDWLVLDNPQTRCLGAVPDVRQHLAEKAGEPAPGYLFTTAYDFSREMDINQVAAQAQRQLTDMTLVGITEHFGESARLLCNLLGIDPPARLPVRNLSARKAEVQPRGYRPQLTPDLLEIVQAQTRHDQVLYDQACELFQAQVAQQRAGRTIYSIAPRLRIAARNGLNQLITYVKRVAPGLSHHQALRGLSRKVRGAL